jgi:hypothetical protein
LLAETKRALAAREERLLTLRTDFDALTIAFWKGFARGLECEDPAQTIAGEKRRMRSFGRVSMILLAAILIGGFAVSLQASTFSGNR